LAIVLFLAPLAAGIPLAVLAAILFVVAWNMSEAGRFARMIKRAPRADTAILLVSFLLTVFADLVIAVNIGVILAMLHFLRRMAASVEVRQATEAELKREFHAEGFAGLPSGVAVYSVEGPFFFGAVESLERALAQTHSDPRVLILRLRWVPFMDMTGLRTLEDAIRDLQKRGVRVMLAGANERVRLKLENAGIIELIGAGNSYGDLAQALSVCAAGLSPKG
jgi:SulP family sulfate permease